MPRGNPKGSNNGGGRTQGEQIKTYEVRPNGDIWSCCKKRCYKLKPTKDKKGYARVCIGGRNIEIHLLVAERYLGPKPGPDYQVDHINRVRDDNRIENLRWVTRSENCENRIFGGTIEQAIEFVRASGYSVELC